MPNDRLSLLMSRIQRWNASHPGTAQDIDPQADIAVARGEGLSGLIGDGGHAFGPHQLNNAGGVITGKFQGRTPEQINQWAWSPAGIDYALQGISRVAGGKHGGDAINAIVRGFERPADPNTNVSRALAAYGKTSAPQGAAPMSPALPASPSGAAPGGNPLLAQLIASTNEMVGLPASPALGSLLTNGPTSNPPAPLSPAAATRTVAPAQGGTLDSLLGRFGLSDAVTSGYRSPADNRRVGGSPTSLHMSNRARDVNPSDPDFGKLVSYVKQNPGAVSEFFYDPLGWYAKNGRIVKGAIGGHGDHAHIGR
jgi:hypothetical protein